MESLIAEEGLAKLINTTNTMLSQWLISLRGLRGVDPLALRRLRD